ncbi:E3 ubiquitin-protein ligase ZFP91 isoform X1 [Rana temporaria]|uniref:E3 ubiquitin-protein ligase ZFP91 isoform X1 n=2 Tax=Rana temporaria TaxID=8407 RepID=UPI001AACD1E7|nr:E3 ubiquitin-protein ligase ZFP91 isoform X1 [Rana temporaria]
MPGGPEPQVRPNRAPGAEGAAGEEEVVTGGSSRRRKAECPRRRRSRREMPGEEEELGLGGRPSYLEEEILANKAPKCEVEEVGVQQMEPVVLIQDQHIEVVEHRAVVREGVLRSTRSDSPTLELICKSEPNPVDLVYEMDEGPSSYTADMSETEDQEEDILISEEDVPFKDDPTDETYRPPQLESEDEEDDEDIFSEEEIYKDDPRDKSYRPQMNRSSAGPRRRGPRSRKESGTVEVKMEVKEENPVPGPEAPRKRGRKRKDDKTPKLPKRRKKPPLQYVRCEMEGCGTVLAHPRYLQHHIKYQHLLKKKYVCPHPSCGRLFRLQKQLMRHAKHHTDQRDYICEYCARAFKSSHNLAVHRMIHTGEKPLQCEFCGFTCRQKASLNWHMKKHDADSFYQFSCGICGKKFEKKDSVVAHKAKSHPEILLAEALAANSGALITANNELLLPETPAALVPGAPMALDGPMALVASVASDAATTEAQEEPAPPQTIYTTSSSKILVACSTQSAGGLASNTQVPIEDADSAGP